MAAATRVSGTLIDGRRAPLIARVHWYVLAGLIFLAMVILLFTTVAVECSCRTSGTNYHGWIGALCATLALPFAFTLVYPIVRARLVRKRRKNGATFVDDGGHADGLVLLRAGWANFLFPGTGLVMIGRQQQAQPYLWAGAGLWLVLLPLQIAADLDFLVFILPAVAAGFISYHATAKAYLKGHFPKLVADSIEREHAMPSQFACPRCTSGTRTDSGWCPECDAALLPLGLGPRHPIARSVAASNANDGSSLKEFSAYPYWMHTASGERTQMKALLERMLTNASHQAFKRVHSTIERACEDPRDPTTVWSLNTLEAELPDGRSLTRRGVYRYRIENEKICELWSYPALLPAPASATPR